MKTNLPDSQPRVASKRRVCLAFSFFLQYSPLFKQQETDSDIADENCEPQKKKRQTVASTVTRKSKGKGKR
jgi:hypothetical protein